MRVRRTDGGRPQGAPTLGLRQYTSGAALSALLVALPLLVAGGSASETAGGATVARGSERPPLSGGIDERRLSGLDLPIVVRDGVRTIANVDGSLPEPPRLATLFVSTVPSGPQGVPASVLASYRKAAEGMAERQPGCRLDWAVLAGIGRIESNHAYGGYVDEHGETIEPILGPVLDGSGDTAAIPDTDDGKYDGDTEWDRAVGPMQFIPSTWRQYGADGNGDGVADPHNIYDATLAAGRYLCSGGLDLSDEEQLRTAVYRYNHSASYVEEVLAWAEAYRNEATEVPDSDVPVAVPEVAAEPAPEPVRFVSAEEAATDTGDSGGSGDSGAREQARNGRAGAPDSGDSGPESSRSTILTATSTTTTTTTSPTTTTTTTRTTTPTTTTSKQETTTPTTTATTPSTSTTTSTSQGCEREAEPTSTTPASSTTTTSSPEPSADAREETCGTDTSEPSPTSTTPTPTP